MLFRSLCAFVHGDATCGRGSLEFGLLQAVDLGATRDATLDQELGPVLVPRQRALGRFRDRLQDRGLGFDLREQRDERFSLEAVLLADAGDEGVDVGARGIESLGMGGLRMAERKRERHREGSTKYIRNAVRKIRTALTATAIGTESSSRTARPVIERRYIPPIITPSASNAVSERNPLHASATKSWKI